MDDLYPLLIVSSVEETVEFYRSKLGFEYDDPEQAAAHLEGDFAILRRDRVVLMFKAVENGKPRPNHTVHEFAAHDGLIVSRDPARLCEELRAKGVRITKELEETEWHTREFHFQDNNGYVFCCGHLIQ